MRSIGDPGSGAQASVHGEDWGRVEDARVGKTPPVGRPPHGCCWSGEASPLQCQRGLCCDVSRHFSSSRPYLQQSLGRDSNPKRNPHRTSLLRVSLSLMGVSVRWAGQRQVVGILTIAPLCGFGQSLGISEPHFPPLQSCRSCVSIFWTQRSP